MTHYLQNKCILLGITGSIAAYKSADLVRRLREVGATVRVCMTENAKRFITPLTLQAVSGFTVHDDLFDVHAEAAMGHIELARWADVICVAPGSADFLTRLANGNANDLLTTICLASKAPIAVAPAMNQGMWKHTLTQENIKALTQRKIHILEPGKGSQACGDVGPGRMMEPNDIVSALAQLFASGKLSGRKVLVTAGPTHEAIDPVRFITNGSSGKMGYALAQAAYEAGADVTLVSGPVNIKPLSHLNTIFVTTAEEMHAAVMQHVAENDLFFAVAAVGDYRLKEIATQKIAKDVETMSLQLVRNPDIVGDVGHLKQRPFIVGFAYETHDLINKANAKRKRKHMDMIIANSANEKESGMGADDNAVIVLTEKHEIAFPTMPKTKLARELIAIIAEEFNKTNKRV